MGFATRASNGSKFINISKGKIVHKDADGNKTEHGSFTGVPIDLDIEDAQYEGVAYRKVVLFMVDPDDGKLYEFGFSLSSGYGNAFSCICPNITENVAIEISPKTEKGEGGKSRTGMFISEDNGDKFVPVKWAITKDNAAKLQRPEPTETIVGKGKAAKKILDFSERNDYYEKVLTKFRTRIVKATGGVVGYKPPKAPKASSPALDITEPIDDLPF